MRRSLKGCLLYTSSHKFLRIEPKVNCVNDAHTQAMLAATMSAEDVAVVFSYSGSTKDTNAVAELAKKNGAKVVAITRFQKSPLTEFTDVILLCGANEGPLQSGSASADISQALDVYKRQVIAFTDVAGVCKGCWLYCIIRLKAQVFHGLSGWLRAGAYGR